MNLLDYLRALRQRWWVLVLVAVIGGAAAGLLTLRAVPVYQSGAIVLVTTPSSSLTQLQTGAQFAESRAPTYAALASTAGVLRLAAAELDDGTTAETLGDHVTAAVQGNTSVIVVTATANDPAIAARRANAVAGSLNSEVQALDIASSASSSPVLLQVIQAGRADGAPLGAGPARNGALGLIAGVALGVALIVLAATLDSKLRTPRDLVAVIGRSPAAIVPRRRRITGAAAPDGRREAFRTLRASLGLGEHTGQSIAVAPVSGSNNASEIVIELGRALAEGGLRVVVVDADLRPERKELSVAPAEGSTQGLAELLEGRAEVEQLVHETAVPRLAAVAAGVPSSRHGQTLNRAAMRSAIARLLQDFDVVVIACPPLLARSDAAITASVAETSLIVVEARKTTRDDLARGLDLLHVLGVMRPALMLNNVSRSDLAVTGGSSTPVSFEARA